MPGGMSNAKEVASLGQSLFQPSTSRQEHSWKAWPRARGGQRGACVRSSLPTGHEVGGMPQGTVGIPGVGKGGSRQLPTDTDQRQAGFEGLSPQSNASGQATQVNATPSSKITMQGGGE